MNEHFRQESNVPETEQNVMAMLKKIQQQLNFLEMKIDKLTSGQGSGGRPSFNKERRFSKPFRPGGSGGGDRHFGGPRPSHPPQGDREGGAPREFSGPKFGGPKSHRPERGRKAFFRKQKSKGQFPPR